MANPSAYSILCCIQLVVGLLMFSFGIVDRTAIQVQTSFLMLPIWIGILAGLAGFYGLIVGRQNKRQGFADVNGGTTIKVITMICIGLSFLAFYMYGSTLSYFGLRDAYNTAIDLMNNAEIKHPKLPVPIIPLDVITNVDTIQGILSVIMILSLAEMFVGSWLVLIDRSQMVVGSSPQQDRRPLFSNQASPTYYQQPTQQTIQVVPQQQQQQQQQQQPVYVMAQGQNVPSNQVYMPSNQPQQPQYVLMNAPPSQQTPTVMVVPNNQNMVPSNQNMVFSNQNMVPSNQYMTPDNQNMVPSNQNMAPSNQNMAPSNQNMVPSNPKPVHAPVQGGEAQGGIPGINQQPGENQETELHKMDSDKNKLI